MRTRLTIVAIILAAAVGAIGVIALLVVALGWLGLALAAVGSLREDVPLAVGVRWGLHDRSYDQAPTAR